MGRSRKRAAAAEDEEEEEAEEEEQVEQVEQDTNDLDELESDELTAQPLQFDEPLSWRAGKPIAVSELLRRLQALAEELSGMRQSMVERESIKAVAQELGHQHLIQHKDKGVVAWTLICITDIFRLTAPHAPYKQSQLKTVFEVLANAIIPALANPSDPYNAQHSAVMQSLTKYRSIVLMTDLPGCDELIHDLFRNCFDVLAGTIKGGRGDQLPKSTAYQFTNLLHFIVDELEGLPPGVLDTILAQFLRADPRAMAENTSREFPPSYAMAMTLCNQSETKMSREVGQYFASVLGNASENMGSSRPAKTKSKRRTSDALDDDEELATPPPELEMNELEKAHSLLRELWRAAPGLITNVIPVLEGEMTSQNVRLRVAATQTIGDMIAGIGAAGPPPPTPLDPAAYPSQSLQEGPTIPNYDSILLRPNVLRAFPSSYPQEYSAFLQRSSDPSSLVRSAWAPTASRILSTNAGGAGLEEQQETTLINRLSEGLVDGDEKVRLASLQAFAQLDFQTFSQKIAKNGSVDQEGSPLWRIAQRPKDTGKSEIRTTAVDLLARLWGVASGAIAENNERIDRLFGSIPSIIFEATYTNKPEVIAAVVQSIYESLLPVGYPPIKSPNRSQKSQDHVPEEDPDAIRTERILVLYRSLTERAKKVLKQILSMQAKLAKYLDIVMDESVELGKASKKDKAEHEKKIESWTTTLVSRSIEPETAKANLIKFCKTTDKRNFHLVRFCYDHASEYRRVAKAMKELKKNLEAEQHQALTPTLLPIIRLCSLLVYNRSHVPPIMEFARTDEKGLGSAAHDMLKDISTLAPDVFKVHLRELCETLKKQAPTSPADVNLGAADTLKACANFARKFPQEMPKDRDFAKCLLAYAKYGNPPKAAKQAVSVLLIVARDKKEMYINDLLEHCINDFELQGEASLPKLATLAQLQLIASNEVQDRVDEIMDIAANKVLKSELTAEDQDTAWSNTIDAPLMARMLALKILVNGIRGLDTSGEPRAAVDNVREPTMRVYALLNTLVRDEGRLSGAIHIAEYQKARLRLAAASQILKLSCNRIFDNFLGPKDFNEVCKLCQDRTPQVRHAILNIYKKYLGPARLPTRFFAPLFLYAFEPNPEVASNALTWLQSRAAIFANQKEPTIFAVVFARFVSVLAHHQDFISSRGLFALLSKNEGGEIGGTQPQEEFEELVRYFTFFLRAMGSEDSVSIIFHIAQRLKSVQDGINAKISDNLYVLSDIAQETIRQFCEAKKWQLSTHPRKELLPQKIFAPLPGGEASKRIAERQFVPNDYLEQVEDLVKDILKPKKRKAEKSMDKANKKAKTAVNGTAQKAKKPKSAKTPKKSVRTQVPDSERRKSGRGAGSVNYAESDNDEEMSEDLLLPDEELEEDGQAEEETAEDEQEEDPEERQNELNGNETPTPPPSERTPRKQNKVKTKPPPKAAAKKAATKAPAKPTRQAPSRSTKAKSNTPKKDRDIMSIPSDTDEEMADV